MFYEVANIWEKLKILPRAVEMAMQGKSILIPELPARDCLISDPEFHGDKKGLSTIEGQARRLHDLASIELQACELALRSLIEFPEAPEEFRDDLRRLTLDEARHCQMCIQGLEEMGFPWGTWPVHLILWKAVSSKDTILDRILIVHRYLEGSGLDAGESLLMKLKGVPQSQIEKIVKVIFTEEIGHVKFGSDWYRKLCLIDHRDPEVDFPERIENLRAILPKRIEKISVEKRILAGFSQAEIDKLQKLRESMVKFPSVTQKRMSQNPT